MFKIDEKVPIPEVKTRSLAYPFDRMSKKGQSFLVEAKCDPDEEPEAFKEEVKKLKGSVGGAARRYAKKFITEEAPKFVTREVELGVRCWLVKEASGEMQD